MSSKFSEQGSEADILLMARAAGCSIATAESLTAGMLAARLADIPGISAVYKGGVIAYDNSVKAQILGVDRSLLESQGSVDPQVALSMAEGAARVCNAAVGISTTGVAGPEPHDGKAVGTVFIGVYAAVISHDDGKNSQQIFSEVYEFNYKGMRQSIRDQATCNAIIALKDILDMIVNS